MKKFNLFFISFLILSSFQLFAQLNDYSIKIGVQGGYVSPDTYFQPDGISYQARLFSRFELGRYFDLGIGAGYGFLSMKDNLLNLSETTIIPADLRMLFTPIVSDVWNPYLTAGVGAVYWKNKANFVNLPNNTVADNNTDIYFPVGIGSEIALSESILLDLFATINITWTEEMTGYNPPSSTSSILSNDVWWTFGIGLAYSSESCSKDSDNDGITDCDERVLRLDPNNSDTDSDGLDDGVELNKYNTDPKNDDSDGDNLKDGEEIITYSTLPLVMDTDKDGVNDFQEVITYKTDPLNADTDSDNLSDGDEILKYRTDPNNSDSDGDKLNDFFEINTSKTNPIVSDSDNDGLDDGSEINKYKTDPNNRDSDNDKLSDGREVNELRTNPLLADTDAGGIDDFLELQLNKNPLDPNDDIASIDLEIVFSVNSAKLTNAAINILIDVFPRAKEILATSNAVIEIQGHTDASGSARANQIISAKRAKSVYDWFIARGIDSSRISYKGYGESQPKYSNKTEEGRAKNRRIELYLSNAE